MAISRGPKLVTNGLVLALDASDDNSFAAQNLPIKNGLVMWLDAADDTTFSYSSGTVVSQWRDKSGLNNHVGQSTVGSQPNRNVVKNSRKSIYFDGGDSLFNAGNVFPSNTTDYTKIAVVYQTSTATTGNVIGSRTGESGSSYAHTIYFGGLNFRMWHSTDIVTSSISLSLNTLGIISATYVNSSGLGSVFLNGTASGTGTAANRNIVRDIEIGGLFGSDNFTGEICEALVFSRVLSAIELKQVHTYLGQKWGVSNTDRSIVDLAGNDDNGLFGNGTVANMPVYDYYNKGLKFNSTNANYVKVGVNSSLQVNTVTIAAFFKTITNGQTTQFIGGYGNTGFYGYWLGMSGGPMVFSVGNSTSNLQLSSTITPNNDQIYYVVGTYDGVTQRIYVDGVLKNSGTTVTGVLSYSLLTDGFLVGQIQGFSSTRYMTGSIYAMQVYNRALTATEILQNYNAQKSRFTNTIVQNGLMLHLDAGNPYSYAGGGTVWYDVSGNGYNAGMNNITPSNWVTYNGVKAFETNDTNNQNFTVGSFPFPQSGRTYEIWINSKSFSLGWQSWFDDGGGERVLFGTSTNTIYVYPSVEVSANLVVGQWYQLLYTMVGGNGTAVVVYKDGQAIGSGTYGYALSSGTGILFILGDSGSEITSCYCSTVRVYNRVLSAAEVLQNYNATKGRFGL